MASGISRKDELFNDLLQLMNEKGVSFSADSVEEEGNYFMQVCFLLIFFLILTNSYLFHSINSCSIFLLCAFNFHI